MLIAKCIGQTSNMPRTAKHPVKKAVKKVVKKAEKVVDTPEEKVVAPIEKKVDRKRKATNPVESKLTAVSHPSHGKVGDGAGTNSAGKNASHARPALTYHTCRCRATSLSLAMGTVVSLGWVKTLWKPQDLPPLWQVGRRYVSAFALVPACASAWCTLPK